jgi:hypothetical protein
MRAIPPHDVIMQQYTIGKNLNAESGDIKLLF